jgi:prolipoprotein diacylglyceryltransferase
MPAAFLPSPPNGLLRIGPLVLHGYALCMVLGVAVAIWVTERRYRAIGGRPWLIVDLATVAVPAGLLGARLYRVVTDFRLYFGSGRDWVDILRIWDGGLGLPGAVLAGLIAAWFWCGRQGAGFGPVLTAAVPGLALSQAIGVWGNWFAQGLYGLPSTWPWAVEISPGHRVPGYQSFGTFQPLFGYESVWDLLVWLLLGYAIARFALTGDRAIALCAGLYAVGRLVTLALRLGPGPHAAPDALVLLAVLGVIGAAIAYLIVTRAKRGPEPLLAGRGRAKTWAAGHDDMRPSPNASRTASGSPPYLTAGLIISEAVGGPEPDELAT